MRLSEQNNVVTGKYTINNPLYKIGYFTHNKTARIIQNYRGADECEKQMVAALPLTLAFVVSITPVASVQAKVAHEKVLVCLSPKMVQLKTDMQKVWIDHTIWTRSYIVSAVSNRPDEKDVLA
jgi:hypothetical protein